MKELVVSGLAAGAITVLLCSSKAGGWFLDKVARLVPKRFLPWYNKLTSCAFCTSWWVSLAMLDEFTVQQWAATVAVANITILLIHWGLSTTEEE